MKDRSHVVRVRPAAFPKVSRELTVSLTPFAQSLLPTETWRGRSKSKVQLDSAVASRNGMTPDGLLASGLERFNPPVGREVIEALSNHIPQGIRALSATISSPKTRRQWTCRRIRFKCSSIPDTFPHAGNNPGMTVRRSSQIDVVMSDVERCIRFRV